MGWWDVGHDDLMIGDPAVDQLARQLRGVVEAREQRGAERPTLGALLAALADALRRKTAMWCGAEEDTPFEGMAARVEHPDGQVELVPQDATTDPELASQLIEAFEDIALLYEDVLDRRPRRAELVAVVAFLLSARPDDHLAIPAGTSVLDVNVRLPGTRARGA
jgi:hypothetical protein